MVKRRLNAVFLIAGRILREVRLRRGVHAASAS